MDKQVVKSTCLEIIVSLPKRNLRSVLLNGHSQVLNRRSVVRNVHSAVLNGDCVLQPKLLDSNFLHTAIAILHDIQALGWSRQSLAVHGIAKYFLGIGRGGYLVDTSRVILNNLSKIAPYIS